MPRRISIDLCRPKTNEAVSVLILGDNGTGKSSIVDAVELALQGTYRRTKRLSSNTLPSLLNLNGPMATSTVEVAFDDDTIATLTVRLDDSGTLNAITQCHPLFQLAPIALRRKDILTFLETPEEKRQVVFLDFFRYGTTAPALPDSEETRALKEKQMRIKSNRRSVLKEIVYWTGTPADALPTTPEDIEEFLRHHVYEDLTRRQRDELTRRGELRLNQRLVALAKDYYRLRDELRACEREIERFPLGRHTE